MLFFRQKVSFALPWQKSANAHGNCYGITIKKARERGLVISKTNSSDIYFSVRRE